MLNLRSCKPISPFVCLSFSQSRTHRQPRPLIISQRKRNKRRFTITFASATNNDWIGCYGSIRYLAHHMNDHFNRKWYAGGFNTGIVLFDFPSVATIRKIYETNPQFSGKFTFICKMVHPVILNIYRCQNPNSMLLNCSS